MVVSNKVYVPNKAEDLNLYVCNMITEINESQTLIKHIPCKCKCKFDGRKCNSNHKWNKDNCWYEHGDLHGMSVNILENMCTKKILYLESCYM